MSKRYTALLLCFLLLCALLPALSETEAVAVRFESTAVSCDSGEEAVLTLVADSPLEQDTVLHVNDNRKNAYSVLLPAGETQAFLRIPTALSASGVKTVFTLQKDGAYQRKAPTECTLTARPVTVYSFSAGVYQTYVGREFSVKVRIANPAKLPAGTPIVLRDDQGTVLEQFDHSQSKQSYTFTYTADEAWRPGRSLTICVGDRALPDAQTLVAAGVSGSKSIYGVHREDTKIAFTMDCGSGADNLPYILDVLDEYGIKITFFMTGKFVEKNPDAVRAVAERGHEIGNHSYSHPSFYDLSGEEMLNQLYKTNALITELTGQVPNLFRPPEGNCNSKIRAIVNAAGFEVIRWTHESYDARKEASKERSLKFSTKDITGGSIILTHIDAKCTVAVLPDILSWYRDNGFSVVPVSELLLSGNTATDENGLQYIIP